MFASKSKAAFTEISTEGDFEKTLTENFVIVFKHSPTCLISRMAHAEVERFHAAHPETPIRLISVRRHRDVSQYIAAQTGVHHESPQILVFQNGKLVGSASHEQITVSLLRDFLREA